MDLNRLSNAALLKARFCDLPIRLQGTTVEQRAERVFQQVAKRGIKVTPSIWLSEEWFNPNGVSGFAVPFYLAHPRLIILERELMLEAEGASELECLRILRHETGHAVDEAFQLHRTPDYWKVFGSPKLPYPKSYVVTPHSRDHVLNLNAWYAQAHPFEDFAETFAVWLQPKWRWRRQYRDWPALEKLEAVDRWMSDRVGHCPILKVRRPAAKLADNVRALADHYDEKRKFYGVGKTTKFDKDLRRIFPDRGGSKPGHLRKSAVGVLRAIRTSLRREVGDPLGVPAYVVDQVQRRLIQRAIALKLPHTRSTDEATRDLIQLVSGITLDLINKGTRLPL
jgi:hypothetical protein